MNVLFSQFKIMWVKFYTYAVSSHFAAQTVVVPVPTNGSYMVLPTKLNILVPDDRCKVVIACPF